MGYTDRIVALPEPILDAHETFLPSFSLSSSRFLIKFEETKLEAASSRKWNHRETCAIYIYISFSRCFSARTEVFAVRFPCSKKTTVGRGVVTLPPPSSDLIIPANLASPFAGEIGNRERRPFPFLLPRPSGDVRPPPPLLPFRRSLNKRPRETDYLQLASHIYMT